MCKLCPSRGIWWVAGTCCCSVLSWVAVWWRETLLCTHQIYSKTVRLLDDGAGGSVAHLEKMVFPHTAQNVYCCCSLALHAGRELKLAYVSLNQNIHWKYAMPPEISLSAGCLDVTCLSWRFEQWTRMRRGCGARGGPGRCCLEHGTAVLNGAVLLWLGWSVRSPASRGCKRSPVASIYCLLFYSENWGTCSDTA